MRKRFPSRVHSRQSLAFESGRDTAGEFRIGEWLIQPELNRIRGPGGEVRIEPKVMDVLVYLARYAGEVLSKERIIQAVWPDAFVSDDVLTHAVSEIRKAEWIPLTDGLNRDGQSWWSPDGNLVYFISNRDGFPCIWAQHLDPVTKRPSRSAFSVSHWHEVRRSMQHMSPAFFSVCVQADKMAFSLLERTGNIRLHWSSLRKSSQDLKRSAGSERIT